MQRSINQEIILLFRNSINQLDKIDIQANKEKKQIVIELAKDLEGKIPIDTISIEIVNQLRGRVSGRFIHDCLEEKYKQKHRVENARKQKKQEAVEVENLAVLPPLNQEVTATLQKELKKIVVDVQGKSVEDKNLELTSPPNLVPTHNNSITNTGDVLKSPQQGINKLKPDFECPSCQDLYAEVIELRDALNKTMTLQTADNMLTSSSSVSPIIGNQLDTLDFEFPLIFGMVRKHMESLYQKIGDGGKVWFSGRIDTSTGRVIFAKAGKIWHQQSEFTDNNN